jgi:hypothetical protein
MPKQNLTDHPTSSQDLFRLKINGHTILETAEFRDCIDQAWMLIHGRGMPASAIDILSLDEKTALWDSVWEEVVDNAY